MSFVSRSDTNRQEPRLLEALSADDLEQSPELLAALVKLNNDHAVDLSWADDARMRQLIAEAFVAQRVRFADALLIAFDQDGKYNSINFKWLRSRFDKFVYVDRVVVAV